MTKRLLQDLKQRHGFASIDEIIRLYLPANAKVATKASLTYKQTYDLTRKRPVDRLIKEASKHLSKLN